MASRIVWPDSLIVPNGGINETQSPQKIGDNQWETARNVEPLPDGMRSRLGSAASNSIVLQSIDISHEAGTDTREFNSGTHFWISQAFTVGGSGIDVSRVAVRLKLNSGAVGGLTAGEVTAAIYTDDGGSPSAPSTVITGAGFGDFSTFDPADSSTGVTSEYRWIHFTLTTATGTHDGAAGAAVLTDTGASFVTDAFIGGTIKNVTDGSSSTVTDNDGTTITGVLSGGTNNSWAVGDTYLMLPAEPLTAATKYWLVVRYANAEATGNDNIGIEEVLTPSGYAGGNVAHSTDGSSWTDVTAADLNFRIYEGEPVITSIIDYRLSDGSNQFHLVGADGEFYKNVSGTMTAVSSRERVALNVDADTRVSYAIGNDRVFITNDSDVSKKFYQYNGTEYWENEGIAAPTATPTLGVAATNALPDGTYYVDYYYWNDDIGQPSDRRYQGVAGANTVTTSTQHITISGLPATTVRENDRATHIRIELREAGATIFRLVKEIAIGTTSTTIGASDLPTTVEAEYDHAVPPVHAVKCVAENRQFILNTANGAWQLGYSAIIGTTPYYESFPANNVRNFGKGDNDYGTALFFIPPRTLVVGFRNSIYAIDARRPGTSDRLLVSSGVGIAGPQAGMVIAGSLYFISDGDRSKGPFVWQPGLNEPQPILGIDSTFKALDTTRYKYASCASMDPGDDRFQWWTLVSDTANGDTILMYDYVLKAWTVYTKGSGLTGNVIGSVEVGGSSQIFMGGRDGVEYQQDTGDDDAGTTYDANVTLKAFDFGAEQIIKRMRWLDYLVASKSSGGIGLTMVADYGRTLNANLDQTGPTGTFTLGTSTLGGTDVMGGNSNLLKRRSVRIRGKVFQPKFNSTNAWHIRGLTMGIQPTGKK
jgi:hypothetical protein